MVTHVLLIDDDRDDREIFCEALERVSIPTVCYAASSVPHAFELLQNPDNPLPDIIFMDINMHLVSGWECLQQLKSSELYKHIPVIMCSTVSHELDKKKSQQLGATCFFAKPFEFNDLVQALKTALDFLHQQKLSSLALHSNMFV